MEGRHRHEDEGERGEGGRENAVEPGENAKVFDFREK